MGDDSKLETVSKFLAGTGLAAGVTLLTSTGFLAVRSYLGALGIPEHAAISVNDYLQYGGRIVFVLALQIAPLMALLLLAALPVLCFLRPESKNPQRGTGLCVAIVLLAGVSIGVELYLLGDSSSNQWPVFAAGRVRLVPSTMKLQLLAVEVLTAAVLLALFYWGAGLWREYRSTPVRAALVLAAFLLASAQTLLLPLCFGQVFMIPKFYDLVVLSRGKDEPALQGALVFSDNAAHFVFTPEKNLVEVPRGSVKEIRYVGRAAIRDLAK